MIIYLIVAIVSTILMYIANNKVKSKNKKILFTILSFVPFFGVMAFRYGIGYDYLNIYDKIFHTIINGGISNWEPGIVYMIKLISMFSNDSFYFFLVTSLLISFFTYKGILSNSEKPWLSLLLFIIGGFYMESMNTVRQFVALAMFIYAIKYIKSKEPIKYIIWILIASLFHTSALVLLPLYFFCRTRLTWKKRLIVSLLLILTIPMISSGFYWILAQTKYSFYMTGVYADANPTYSELIIASILFIAASIFYKRGKDNEWYNIYYNLTFVFLIIGVLSFKVLLAYRIIMYLKITTIFMVPSIIGQVHKSKNRIIYYMLFIIFFSAITILGAYKFGWYDTQYISIFEKWGV